MSQPGDVHRLFFALWPDAALRTQILGRSRAAIERCGGRPVPRQNLHITLLFIGDVAQPVLEQVLGVGAALTAPAFELQLDRIEMPDRGRVMWLGTSQPRAAAGLASRLRLGNLSTEHTAPYRPHVTLVRDPVQRLPPMTIDPVVWPVRDLVLVRSQLRASAPEYAVIARWPLQG